jgi:protein-S-isoprenylcysteine O-methyltransferase Ste14
MAAGLMLPLRTLAFSSHDPLINGNRAIAHDEASRRHSTPQSMNQSLAHFLPIAAVVAGYLARMSEVFTKRDVVPGARKESVTFSLFMLCGILIVVGSITEYLLRHSALWWPTFIAGVACSLASFAIRRSAIRALGKFWSLHVEMRNGHEFVTTGPFAHARHPVYFSMILELLSVGLMLNAWISLALVFAIFTPTLIARVRIEERAMIETFGEAYKEYMQTTPAILPTGRRSG